MVSADTVFPMWDMQDIVFHQDSFRPHVPSKCREMFKKNQLHLDGLVQDCSNSSALAMVLLQFYTKPSNFHISSKEFRREG